MLIQLVIGSVVILATMGVMVGFIYGAIRFLRALRLRLSAHEIKGPQFFIMMSSAVILVLIANTLCVWIWAIVFRVLGVFLSLEEAVYFSIVSFTTVGYGDVVVSSDWRILSGFVAVNGLLAFGLFTAFLIEMIREITRHDFN